MALKDTWKDLEDAVQGVQDSGSTLTVKPINDIAKSVIEIEKQMKDEDDSIDMANIQYKDAIIIGHYSSGANYDTCDVLYQDGSDFVDTFNSACEIATEKGINTIKILSGNYICSKPFYIEKEVNIIGDAMPYIYLSPETEKDFEDYENGLIQITASNVEIDGVKIGIVPQDHSLGIEGDNIKINGVVCEGNILLYKDFGDLISNTCKSVIAMEEVFEEGGSKLPKNCIIANNIIEKSIDVPSETNVIVGNIIAGAPQAGGAGGETVELDTTLTQEGKAADAKAVGDAVNAIQERIDKVDEKLDFQFGWTKELEAVEGGYYIINTTTNKPKFISSASWKYAVVDVYGNNGGDITINTYITSGSPVMFVDKDDNVLTSYYGASGNANILNTTTTTVTEDMCKIYIPCYSAKDMSIDGVVGLRTEFKTLKKKVNEMAVTDEELRADIEANTANIETSQNRINAFLKKSDINLLNPSEIYAGYLGSKGGLNSSDSFLTTEYISVTAGDCVRTTSTIYSIAFYNTDKKFISYYNDQAESYIAPENAVYFRITFLTFPTFKYAKSIMVYVSDAEQPFVPYEIIDKRFIEAEVDNFPEIDLMLTKDLYVAEGVTVGINHQSVLVNYDVSKAIRSGTLIGKAGNNFRTYGYLTSITGGEITDNNQFAYKVTADYDHIKQKGINVYNVSADAGNGQTKKVLFIGDSKTDANIYTQHLLDMFADDVMNIELLGTRGNSETNRHEGRSGWSAEFYCENNAWRGIVDENGNFPDSPFFNPNTETFDFAYYMNKNNYDSVDYVFINLGTNDSISNFIEYYHQMIDGIRAYNSNIIIGIWVPAPFATFGGYSHRDNDNQTFLAMKKVIEEFDTAENQDNKIFVIPTHMNINTFYDFGWKEVRYNDVSEETYRVCTDQIHEVNGYKHVADVIFGYIKHFATLS